jgi:LacI family transcriptional regulator
MAVTMKDVAERAGVSLPTVSRVINDSDYVNAETRARVLAAIEELQYVPNHMAVSLRSQRTKTIALLVPDIASSFWTTVSRGIEDEASARGFHVFLGNTDDDPDKEARYIDGLLRRRVDGLVIAPTRHSVPVLRRLKRQGMQIVIVHRNLDSVDVDTVRSDAYSSAVLLTQHLLGAGRRRIAFIGGEIEQGRLAGYRDTLAAAGQPPDPDLVKIGPLVQREGERLVGELLAMATPPDAVLIGNNRLALGALHALASINQREPGKIAIAAFYDPAALNDYAPPMIAAIQPAYEIGRFGARRLLDRLAGAPVESRDTILANRIVIVRGADAPVVEIQSE